MQIEMEIHGRSELNIKSFFLFFASSNKILIRSRIFDPLESSNSITGKWRIQKMNDAIPKEGDMRIYYHVGREEVFYLPVKSTEQARWFLWALEQYNIFIGNTPTNCGMQVYLADAEIWKDIEHMIIDSGCSLSEAEDFMTYCPECDDDLLIDLEIARIAAFLNNVGERLWDNSNEDVLTFTYMINDIANLLKGPIRSCFLTIGLKLKQQHQDESKRTI